MRSGRPALRIVILATAFALMPVLGWSAAMLVEACPMPAALSGMHLSGRGSDGALQADHPRFSGLPSSSRLGGTRAE